MKRFICVEICDKKWMEVNDLSCGQYSVNKNISFKTSMLRSDLCKTKGENKNTVNEFRYFLESLNIF